MLDPRKILAFVAVTSAFGKQAMAEVEAARAVKKQAAALQPQVLEALVSTASIGEHQKQAAAAMLGDHAKTLTLLKNAVVKLAAAKSDVVKTASDRAVGRLGAGENASIPEFDSLSSPFVGQRTTQKKASDHALLRAVGLED